MKPHNYSESSQRLTGSRSGLSPRQGKILVLFSVLLPAILSVSGLVIDVGVLLTESGQLEHIADAAATAAARDLLNDKTISEATATATAAIAANADLSSTKVTINIPPASGPHLGDGNYVEVLLSRSVDTYLIDFGASRSTATARAVAGHEAVTGEAAIIVLSDRPVSWHGYYGYGESGMAVLGAGSVDVTGAILVNDECGQFDENGHLAGLGPGMPYGINSGIPLYAPYTRVVGGVNDPSRFHGTISGVPSLSANRMPVKDPLEFLPVPTVGVDDNHVHPTEHGSVELVDESDETELEPGVYEWIRVINSEVKFKHGVFIIRNVNPATNIGLEVVGSDVDMDSVMFYITNNTSYSALNGIPDAYDELDTAPWSASTIEPSVDIRISGDSRLRGLDHSGTPYHNMLIFQRRWDRRWIRLEYQGSTNGQIRGTIYTPSGKVSVYTDRDLLCQFVVGSLRLYNYNGLDVYPPNPFPPVRDVFLVE